MVIVVVLTDCYGAQQRGVQSILLAYAALVVLCVPVIYEKCSVLLCTLNCTYTPTLPARETKIRITATLATINIARRTKPTKGTD